MRSFFRDISIGAKINGVLIITSLTAMVAMGSALWVFQSQSYKANMEANLLSTAMIIADNSASSIIFDDNETAGEILGSLKNIPGFESALLLNSEDEVLAIEGLKMEMSENEINLKWPVNQNRKKLAETLGTVVTGDGYFFVDQPINYGQERVGKLRMIFSLAPMAEQNLLLARFVVLVFIATLGLVVLAGNRFQRLISGPLMKLVNTAGSVAENQDFALRVEVTSNDETGLLTKSFNTMLTTIQEHEKNLVNAVEKADKASKAKGQFLANMSHEIRTPMNGIIGMSDLLMDSNLNTDQKDNLEVIQHSADQLLGIINEILDFSKVESGHVELAVEAFDLPRILNGVEKMMTPTASQKGLTIKTIIDKMVPGKVMGDPVRLRQILINMAGNAVKFTDSGEIEIRVIHRGDRVNQARLRFEIIDQGIGIAPEKLDIIFSQFTQVDNSNTRSYGGTGLGLAICKLLTELMEGEIGVNSVVGEGSTFWFEIELPRLSDQSEIKEVESEPARPLMERKKYPYSKVLVAEDNITNQLVISKTLKRLGCEVDIAKNGQEAVDMLEASSPAYGLVLMDCQMPVMDGYEATGLIRRMDGRKGKTPVVALTASAMPEDRERALAAKMDDYLSKPVKLFALRAALEKWVWETKQPNRIGSEEKPKPRKIKVLVAEDNMTNQKVVSRLLGKLDCDVDLASDGVMAVNLVQNSLEPYDIVFMDCHMPNMDGYDATDAIRKLPDHLSCVPIVALTAASSAEDIAKSLKSGMNAHLTKPARKKALQLAIEQWVGCTTKPEVEKITH